MNAKFKTKKEKNKYKPFVVLYFSVIVLVVLVGGDRINWGE